MFSKRESIDLIKCKYFPEIIAEILNVKNEKVCLAVFAIISKIANSLISIYSQKNDVYTRISQTFYDFGVFEKLFRFLEKLQIGQNEEFPFKNSDELFEIMSTLEFCSSTEQGL